jgi:hypothetical protein
VKIFIWTVSMIFGLIVAALAFVFRHPDDDLYTACGHDGILPSQRSV